MGPARFVFDGLYERSRSLTQSTQACEQLAGEDAGLRSRLEDGVSAPAVEIRNTLEQGQGALEILAGPCFLNLDSRL